MIRHQAPAEHFTYWCEMFIYFMEKESVIPVSEEDGLFVVSPVVDMIYIFGCEMHRIIF